MLESGQEKTQPDRAAGNGLPRFISNSIFIPSEYSPHSLAEVSVHRLSAQCKDIQSVVFKGKTVQCNANTNSFFSQIL